MESETWDYAKLGLIAVGVIIALWLVFIVVRAVWRNDEQHQAWLKANCHIIAQTSDMQTYGYYNGHYQYYTTPGTITYKCNNGQTLTEQQ